MKIRVTHFLRQSNQGGFSIENVFERLRMSLSSEFEVKVYSCRYGARGFWGKWYEIIRVCFFQSEVNHIAGDAYFLDLLLPKKRTCVTFHDTVTPDHSKGLKKWLVKIFWYWIPEKRARVVVAVSEFTKKQVIAHTGCRADKIRVIHNPLSEGFEKKTRVPKKRPRVLMIGTGRTKNTVRILEALSGLDCDVSIVGPLNSSQLETITKYKISHEVYLDLTSTEILKQYELSDIVVFASTYEGFGLPIIEAQAVGRPVVTSQMGSMPEIAGEAACFVDPFDVPSIRAGIFRVLENPEYSEQLIQLGFENVKRFSSALIAEKYAEIYRELASK